MLGATGSIGTATVDVLENLNRVDRDFCWHLWAASGHRNVKGLSDLAASSAQPPRCVILSDPTAAASAEGKEAISRFERIGTGDVQVSVGPDALVEAARDADVDIVVAAIVGRAGLESTLAAVNAGKRIGIANKETLVVAGPLVSRAKRESGAEIGRIRVCGALGHGGSGRS